MQMNSFNILHQSKISKARLGLITTPHGVIETPNFVAVGTNGSIKALDSATVDSLGLQLMFCNTYHLMLQPGTDVVKAAGGLHTFINRKQPIITDSGGFQVFSLAYGSVASELKSCGAKKNDGCVLKINEEGVLFRSYRDGSKLLLTPESSIQAQKDLGADIIIPFDELPPYHIDPKALRESLDRTHRWEKRSLDEHLKEPKEQMIYAVVHGGVDPSLRQESCRYLSSLPFNGFAIGGSVGKNKQEMRDLLSFTTCHLPYEFPTHLLGIGDVESISLAIPFGIDTFDSSYPTRAARHGILLSKEGSVNLTRRAERNNPRPICDSCSCSTCSRYSRAYLHHLYKAKEPVILALATIHNLHFMVNRMKEIREKIALDLI